jgi:hypothetical protein
MTNQGELTLSVTQRDADLLNALFSKADRILIKKLSNNDRDWARYDNKHQAGVYMPHEQRDGGFFPPLEIMSRDDPDADEIREVKFPTFWPQVGGRDARKRSRLVHYTSKGQETHMTRLPKSVFAELLPASFLVMGRTPLPDETAYECLTIDSASDEASLLLELFDLGPEFLIGEFDPVELKKREHERVLDFTEQLIAAWLKGEIDLFARENAVMPNTAELALLARQTFLERYGLDDINPFSIEAPGDVLREISRNIEWDLFRDFQRKERSVELVKIVLGNEPVKVDAPEVVRRLVDQLPAIDALMLSASQQRKSRAGYSYEHHIEAMLTDGGIPFEKQVNVEAKKRPDFILPSLAFIDSGKPGSETGLILSAKTTLRERWKQVEREKGKRSLYLTTVDENIAGNVIEDMASFGVHLVIPESLKKSEETEYKGHKNVLSFREFCDSAIQPHLAVWQP